MAKKGEVATSKVNLPANWEQKLAQDAQKAVKQEASVSIGQFMSIRGGILQFQQTPVPGNKFQGVILAAILENAYYTEEFDPQNPTSPACYAFGEEEADMKPHEQAPDKQSEACVDCRWNKFGTAEKGRGKACKNSRRMALIHMDDLKKDARDWTVAFLKIPPTSLPGWASYVRSLSEMAGRPPYAVVTEVAVVPDTKSQYKVTFNLVKKIDDKKALASVFAKHGEMEKTIGFPYQVMDGDGAAKPAKGKKKAAKPAERNSNPPGRPGGSPFGGGSKAAGKQKF